MLEFFGSPAADCSGVSRRSFLKVGALTVGGLTLPGLLRMRATRATESRPSKSVRNSVILIYQAGGQSQGCSRGINRHSK